MNDVVIQWQRMSPWKDFHLITITYNCSAPLHEFFPVTECVVLWLGRRLLPSSDPFHGSVLKKIRLSCLLLSASQLSSPFLFFLSSPPTSCSFPFPPLPSSFEFLFFVFIF